ncbi:MAG: Npt1/Npt2 family nucleotide transporter, partial [Planctomycetota bacterium]
AMAFGALVHRMNRRRFIPIGFRAAISCLLIFAALLAFFAEQTGAATGRIFYVWLSVANLFLTSVFWAFMADTWTLPQGKRLFPVIGVGGTVGAILGSTFAWQLGAIIGPIGCLLAAAALFELAARCMLAIDRRDTKREQHQTGRETIDGIGLVDGLAFVARSPYLLGVAAYIVLIAISSTLIYFTQGRLVIDASDELETRIALFGQLDLLAQGLTLIAQLFVISRVIRLLGVGTTLGILPLVTTAGFAALLLVERSEGVEPWQVFAVFAVFQAVHRATRYAVARPARETLFGVLTPDEKYKAKTVVDLAGYRGGDVAGARIDAAFAAAGLTLGGLTLAVAPMAALWIGLSAWLGLAQHRKARTNASSSETPPPAVGTPSPEGDTR